MDMDKLLQSTQYDHSRQVARISTLLARLAGYTPAETETIGQAALFHDIGKTAIPTAILNTPGALTQEEYAVVKTHTAIGQERLSQAVQTLAAAIIVAQQHHERLDGSGYLRMEDKDIHPYAKLIAVADVFDALVSRRSYKEPWGIDRTGAYLQDLAGVQFECRIVALLLSNMDQVLALYGPEKNV